MRDREETKVSSSRRKEQYAGLGSDVRRSVLIYCDSRSTALIEGPMAIHAKTPPSRMTVRVSKQVLDACKLLCIHVCNPGVTLGGVLANNCAVLMNEWPRDCRRPLSRQLSD